MKRVLVVGGANYDLTATAPRLPSVGETVLATGYRESLGGKAANIACAAAAWGAPVTFVGRVGDDSYGDALLQAWIDAGIDISYVRRDAVGTGLGIVFMDASGGYQTVVVPRANAHLGAADVEGVPSAAWADVGAVTLALEAPAQATLAATSQALQRALPLILNAAPAEGMTAALWPTVSHLVVNEHEAALLTAAPVDDVASAFRAAERLLARLEPGRARAVIVTLGRDGAVLVRPARGPRHVPSPTVDAKDTLGAGDTFVGVLAAEIAREGELEHAVVAACAAAAVAVTVEGARAAVTPERVRAAPHHRSAQPSIENDRPKGAIA